MTVWFYIHIHFFFFFEDYLLTQPRMSQCHQGTPRHIYEILLSWAKILSKSPLSFCSLMKHTAERRAPKQRPDGSGGRPRRQQAKHQSDFIWLREFWSRCMGPVDYSIFLNQFSSPCLSHLHFQLSHTFLTCPQFLHAAEEAVRQGGAGREKPGTGRTKTTLEVHLLVMLCLSLWVCQGKITFQGHTQRWHHFGQQLSSKVCLFKCRMSG